METDNVLVSREKWEAIMDYMNFGHNPVWALNVLAMPDYIKSERDEAEVAGAIYNATNSFSNRRATVDKEYVDHITQAVINALRYTKRG